MRRIRLATAAAWAFSAVLVFDNTVHALSLGAGLKGGADFSFPDVSGYKYDGGRTGFTAGGDLELGVTSPYSLVVEALYSQKGATLDLGGIGSNKVEGKVDYLEVPVLAKAKFGTHQANLYLFAGPSFGFNLTAEGDFSTILGSDTAKLKDNVGTLSLAGDVGLGAQFKVAQYVYLTGDVRYSQGFNDILDKDIGGLKEWKNRDVQAMVGLLFDLVE